MDLCSAFAPKILPPHESFLARGSSCPGCGQALAVRLIGKAIGHRGRFPYGEVAPDAYYSALPSSRWQKFVESPVAKTNGKNKSLKNIRAIVVDSGMLPDILPVLDEAKRARTPFLLVCCFNEAGIWRHPSGRDTILKAENTGGYLTHIEKIQEVLEAVRRLRLPFTATATTAHPFDLIQKVIQGLDCGGPSFLGLLTACPTGCRYPAASARQAMLRAVQSGFFPIFTERSGTVTLQTPTKGHLPIEQYLKLHYAYLYTNPEDIAAIQKRANEYMALLAEAANSVRVVQAD